MGGAAVNRGLFAAFNFSQHIRNVFVVIKWTQIVQNPVTLMPGSIEGRIKNRLRPHLSQTAIFNHLGQDFGLASFGPPGSPEVGLPFTALAVIEVNFKIIIHIIVYITEVHSYLFAFC
jgi:hypothetical protein